MPFPKFYMQILSLLLFAIPFEGVAQFQQCNSNTKTNLKDVIFLNDQIGLAVGDTGTIIRSSDGGLNWSVVFSVDSVSLNRVRFFNASNAIAVGSDIFLSSDTGKTWSSLSIPDYYQDIEVLNDTTCVVSGINKAILKSHDMGYTWDTLVSKNSNEEFGLLSFINEKIGYTCHYGGGMTNNVLKTRDGGETWSVINTLSGIDNSVLEALEFISEDVGYRAGWYNGHLMKSIDSAYNWSGVHFADSNYWGQLIDLHVNRDNAAHLFACGWYGDILKSVDYGNTWHKLISGASNTTSLYGIYFLNDTLGWVVGANGTVLKTVNGGGYLGISEPQITNRIVVFPVPASDFINVQFPDFGAYRIIVYNLDGKEVLRLNTSASNQVQINLSILSAGIHILTIRGNRINESHKIDIVK